MPEPQYVRRSYAGGSSVAQLVQQVGSTDTTFTIAPVTGWLEEDGQPLGTVGPFTVVIDRFTPQVEKILCRSINLSTGLVSVYVATDGWSGRGYDGTIAITHVPSGSTSGVQTCWSSKEADEANQVVYDLLGPGGSVSGLPIGALIPFGGNSTTVPAAFLTCDGSSYLRSTYSALFTAITVATTGTTTAGGSVVTNIPPIAVAAMNIGMQVTLANSGGAIYTVASVPTTTSIVLNTPVGVTAGIGGSILLYPWSSIDSTHFNVPDLRGRSPVGAGFVATVAQPGRHVGDTGGQDAIGATGIAYQPGASSAYGLSNFTQTYDSPYATVQYIIRAV